MEVPRLVFAATSSASLNPHPPPTSKRTTVMTSDTLVFERLQSYSFESDPEFAKGLSIILGHPETPASKTEINRDDDLVLQAKCFFFSRYTLRLSVFSPVKY